MIGINPLKRRENIDIMCKRLVAIILTGVIMLGVTFSGSTPVSASTNLMRNVNVTIEGGLQGSVRAIDADYENNLYISLRDLAVLLAGTQKAINVSIGDGKIDISSVDTTETERVLTGWTDEEKGALTAKAPGFNALFFNEAPRKYYSLRAAYGSGTDCFMSPENIAMLLDMNISSMDRENVTFNVNSSLIVEPEVLEEDGYFQEVNCVLVGDASTGDIFYEYSGDVPYPIASTTKLMTLLLTEEALQSGAITMDTVFTVSERAAQIAESADGNTAMKTGQQLPVSELVLGAMLPSSNECAFTLAEGIAGNEETFVSMMNDKAAELSMDTALFYNSNGLPSFSTGHISKRQNHMSAEDMFKMCSYLLNNYPQIKEITSKTDASLYGLQRDVKNTNALLYNMPEVNGLKTGTTDKAGACLVTSLTVNDGTIDHDLVVVVLGAEGARGRFGISEMMARYAKNVVLGISGSGNFGADGSLEGEVPEPSKKVTAGSLVKMIVNSALKQKNTVN